MKIGICMFLWTTHVTAAHEKLLGEIADAGYDGVEIPVFEGEPEQYRELGKLLDRLGLERTAVSAIGDPDMHLVSPDPAVRAAGVERMRWAIECSSALGATHLAGPLHSTLGHFTGTGPTQDELQWSLQSQQAIGDHAARAGVTIALEALNRFECYLFNTMRDLCGHLAELNHPNITAMYDTFHANIEEQDPIAALLDNRAHITHIHISENDRGVPGRGNIPWSETYAAIRETGYDDWLTIESFGRGLPDLAAATKVWRDFAESPEAVYREGIAHIRKSMKAAGMAA